MEPPSTVAIVGGGYVGVEMAEAISAHDVDAHLFQRSSHVLPPFGEAVGERVVEHLADNGVTLHLDTPVSELRGDSAVEGVTYGNEILPVDAVERLDLAYAPQFSPVWGPVLTAAKVFNGTLSSGDVTCSVASWTTCVERTTVVTEGGSTTGNSYAHRSPSASACAMSSNWSTAVSPIL
ncbi:NAD(P)/FAD-dependent oxidoreductase [Halomicrococcus gelatinilyticus]|uniref:NAD(P)/FAD-dependent oxidoreductase n=1 Tax=Halomicrococcus gelatinilyticus TaxID=1702103 RepID=UPI003898F04B